MINRAQRSWPHAANPLLLFAVLSLALVGCTTTDPKEAFDALNTTVANRTGQRLQWSRGEKDDQEIRAIVQGLLQTNLTADSSVTIALLNNRTLQAEFEELGISQAELAQTARLRNPTFSSSYRLPIHPPTILNAEYQLTQDLLDLLTLPTRKRVAAANLEQTKLLLANTVLNTAAEAKAAFYTVQARQQLLGRLQAVMEVNEAGADLAARQHKAGNITALELANQAAVFQQSKLEWGKTLAQVKVDRERLNRALGLWGPDTQWKISEQLQPLPEKELALDYLETMAVTQRFDLTAARTQLQTLESMLRLKKNVRWVPAISLGVNAEHDLDHSWVIGPTLDLEVPIFDQGQSAVARLAAQYRQSQRRLEALATDIRSEVRQARDTLVATRDLAEYYGKVYLPQRIRIVNETLLQYNAMQEGPLALIAAKERELSAEREYAEAWRDYWLARAELEKAVGGRLDANPQMPHHSSEPPRGTPKPENKHEHHK